MKWLSKQGFTLIELGVVLSLFLLVVTLVQVNVGFLDRIIANTQVTKLQTICRYLQRVAMVSNIEQELVFNPTKNCYSYQNHTETLPKQIFFNFIPGAKGPPACANVLIQKPITFVNNRILFYPTGIISAGTIYLVDRKKKIMYALSNAVSQISFLRAYCYNGTWQSLY